MLHKLKLFRIFVLVIRTSYGTGTKIQGNTLRQRLGDLGDCHRQEGDGLWLSENRSS